MGHVDDPEEQPVLDELARLGAELPQRDATAVMPQASLCPGKDRQHAAVKFGHVSEVEYHPRAVGRQRPQEPEQAGWVKAAGQVHNECVAADVVDPRDQAHG